MDSPLPFSIPINLNNKTMATIKSGIYPIALKITYSDDLKIPHQLIVNSSIDYQPSQSQTKGGSHGDGGLFGIKIGNISGNISSANCIIAIIALAIILFIRKRKRKAKSQVSTIENSKDMELFLDDISTSPSSSSSSSSPSNPQHSSPSFLKLVLQTRSRMYIEGKQDIVCGEYNYNQRKGDRNKY